MDTANVELQEKPRRRWLPRMRFRLSTMLLTIALAATLLGWGIDHIEQRKQVRALESHFELSFSDDERAALQYFADARCPIVMRAFHASTLGDEDLKWVSMLPTLDYLVVDNATDDGLVNVARLKRLRSLTIMKSPTLSDRGITHLGELTNLEYLHLYDGQLTDKAMESIGRLAQLKSLDVRGTRISSDGVAYLRDLRELQALRLSQNPDVDDRALEYIAQLPELTHLSISASSVNGDGLNFLSQMPRLEVLVLQGSSIDGSGLDQLANAESLRRLDLSFTSVGDDDIDKLATLSQLETLAVYGTRVTPDGVNRLRAALPDCTVTD